VRPDTVAVDKIHFEEAGILRDRAGERTAFDFFGGQLFDFCESGSGGIRSGACFPEIKVENPAVGILRIGVQGKLSVFRGCGNLCFTYAELHGRAAFPGESGFIL